MTEKSDFYKTSVSHLKAWDEEFQRLNARRAKLNAAAHAQYDKRIEELRQNRDATFVKLEELGTASEMAWRDMKFGFDEAWTSLKTALSHASSEFKKTKGPGT